MKLRRIEFELPPRYSTVTKNVVELTVFYRTSRITATLHWLGFMINSKEDFFDGSPGDLLVFKSRTTSLVTRSYDCSKASICLRSPYGELALRIKHFTWDQSAEDYLADAREKWKKACLPAGNLRSKPSLKPCAESIRSTMRVHFAVFDDIGVEDRKTYFDNEVFPRNERPYDTTKELDAESLISIAEQGISL